MTSQYSHGVVCCFCFESVPQTGDEPITLYARGARDESEQGFYAHLACFKRALHPRVPIGVAILGEDEGPVDSGDAPDAAARPAADSLPAV